MKTLRWKTVISQLLSISWELISQGLSISPQGYWHSWPMISRSSCEIKCLRVTVHTEEKYRGLSARSKILKCWNDPRKVLQKCLPRLQESLPILEVMRVSTLKLVCERVIFSPNSLRPCHQTAADPSWACSVLGLLVEDEEGKMAFTFGWWAANLDRVAYSWWLPLLLPELTLDTFWGWGGVWGRQVVTCNPPRMAQENVKRILKYSSDCRAPIQRMSGVQYFYIGDYRTKKKKIVLYSSMMLWEHLYHVLCWFPLDKKPGWVTGP